MHVFQNNLVQLFINALLQRCARQVRLEFSFQSLHLGPFLSKCKGLRDDTDDVVWLLSNK